MKGFARQLRIHIVTPISFALVLLLGACAANKVQQELPIAMSPTALALYNEGAALFQKKDFEGARERYQAALEGAQLLGDTPGIGFSLAAIGAAQQALKEYDQALHSFKAALSYLKASKNVAAEALTFAAIGEVQIQLGHDASAIEAFKQALPIAETLLKQASDPEKLLIFSHREKVLFRQAQAYERLGDYSAALKSYREAADDSKKTGNVVLASAALWGAGLGSEQIGDLGQAITLYTEAASLAERAGDIKEATSLKWQLAQAQLRVGKFEDSVKAFSLVTNVAEREGWVELAASGYFGAGEALERLSDFEKALASYRSALRHVRAGNWENKAKLEADTLFHMGVIHRWLSQYEEAIEQLRTAALKYQETGTAMRQADALAQLAEIFFWIAEPKMAVGYYKQALESYRKIGDHPKQIEVLAALGEAGYLTDEVSTEDGEKYFKDGQQLVGSLTGFDPFVRVIAAKGKTLTQEELNKIFQEWREKLPTLKSEYRMAAGILYQKWGKIFLDGTNPEAAQVMLLPAFEYHSMSPLNREAAIELAKDAYFLGEAFRQLHGIEDALKYFRLVEQLGNQLRTPETHFAYSGLARTYADLGDTEKALQYYRKGIEGLESIQGDQGIEDIKIGVFAGALYAYRGFVGLLLDVYKQTNQHEYLEESFEYNERMRARVFLEMLASSQGTRAVDGVRSESLPLEETRRKIAQIHHRLQIARLEPSAEARLLDELENVRQKWRTAQKDRNDREPRRSRILFSQSTTIAKVQAALDKDSALLEYATAPDGSILWAITKEQVRTYKLPGATTLSTLQDYLKSLRQPLLGKGEIFTHVDLGEKLYRDLVEPAREMIEQKKHLIIAPDGPLHYLPFEALVITSAQISPKRISRLEDVNYLVKQYRVTYVPSASVLVAQQSGQQLNKPQAELQLLAFGDPVYGNSNPQSPDIRLGKTTNLALRDQSLTRLEFSGDEVRRIARVLGVAPDSEHINLQSKATVERLRSTDLSRYRVLHFAAHAILGDQVKTLSQPALVLSPPPGNEIEGGLLQFSDILDLKLNADLVVLSACETGLGRLRDGEGIVGLTRAFLYAGASSAVVSLWKVQDQSTSLLMERFYRNLKRGLSKSEALRQAKLDIMHSTVELKATGMHQDLASPFYWAPFILVGDWGPIQTN